MKKRLTLAIISILAFILGAFSMYVFKREHRPSVTTEWIPVKAQEFGVRWAIDIVQTDIPEPKTDPPSGKVMFLNRDKGIQLGYLLKLPIRQIPRRHCQPNI